jgi:DNA-binding PadR family transcriptional regulator
VNYYTLPHPLKTIRRKEQKRKMTKHYFRVEVAKEVGINAAVIYENIAYWIKHNAKTGKNEKDGKHWMYSTQKELSEQFDYLSLKQVRTALDKLESAGYIIKGNYNRHGYDRTTWYALTDKAAVELEAVEAAKSPRRATASNGEGKYPRRRSHSPKRAEVVPIWLDGKAERGVTIQDSKTDDEKERLLKRMRKLAAECGAVCTV